MLRGLLEQKIGPEFITARCLRMRFAENDCQICESECPAGAISITDGVKVNTSRCTDCGLCSATCPSLALQNSHFSIRALIGKLRAFPQPV